jgi:NAD+ synthase (glutamine-hydrolysing)
LPPYPVVDSIVEGYVEMDLNLEDIVARGVAAEDVTRITGLIVQNEYKRSQAPIGVRITPRGFGKDWRYPVTNRFRPRLV